MLLTLRIDAGDILEEPEEEPEELRTTNQELGHPLVVN